MFAIYSNDPSSKLAEGINLCSYIAYINTISRNYQFTWKKFLKDENNEKSPELVLIFNERSRTDPSSKSAGFQSATYSGWPDVTCRHSRAPASSIVAVTLTTLIVEKTRTRMCVDRLTASTSFGAAVNLTSVGFVTRMTASLTWVLLNGSSVKEIWPCRTKNAKIKLRKGLEHSSLYT